MDGNAVSGRTRVCGVIGDPVEHTVSPAMHNAAFAALGIDYIYLPFRVRKEHLGRAMDGVRGLNIRGMNVTIPHKIEVMAFLDEIEPLARRIGAVNAITNDDGFLTGSNTDAGGFIQALLEHGAKPAGRKAVVLGAGGASRAISFALAEKGARLVILNRHPERARDLARQISDLSPGIEAGGLSEEDLSAAMRDAEILVNTTSAGMTPEASLTPVPVGLLRPGLTVFDIVYNPAETRLLREARAAGAAVIGGVDMLAWQGALAFEKWTGRKAPVGLMKQAAMRALGHEN
ncbi:MAG: shikimate dehydrogenase [Chloroflexi bacterium]|nr:shikimate dehydrogenase [Chloroflexota bacterium]